MLAVGGCWVVLYELFRIDLLLGLFQNRLLLSQNIDNYDLLSNLWNFRLNPCAYFRVQRPICWVV